MERAGRPDLGGTATPARRELAPLGERAMQALAPVPGDRLLDIGCGCGTTTIAFARGVAPTGSLGLDISGPMVEAARRNATAAHLATVHFVKRDAETTHFGAPFDAALSRFGVMFFAHPEAAFMNIRANLRPGAASPSSAGAARRKIRG